jgi:hypothetical protein
MRHDSLYEARVVVVGESFGGGFGHHRPPGLGSALLFSQSPGHGPSLLDLIGIVVLVAGWAVLDVAT